MHRERGIKILILIPFIFLFSCSDSGQAIPELQNDPNTFVELINGSEGTAKLYFRHGENVCFGNWTYFLYANCKHPFHGEDGPPDVLDFPHEKVEATDLDVAIASCKVKAESSNNIPLGVDLLGHKAKPSGEGVFLCLATISVPKFKMRRSKVCGPDYSIKQQSIDQLLVSLDEIIEIEGSYLQECFSCDDIEIEDYDSLQNKYFCLVGNYLKLSSKAMQPLTEDQKLIKTELYEVMELLYRDYSVVLSKEQRNGLEKIFQSN